MDPPEEIDDPIQLLLKESAAAVNGLSSGGYEDLQTKYSSLHENYSKEVENSKKVEKCLVKCLKLHLKLCKKYEAQQKIVLTLEENLREKVHALEESIKTQEKLNGVIKMYRAERVLFANISCENLRKDKEILLDICCRLISESVKSNNIRYLANVFLRKFKNDLNDEKLNLLKEKEPFKKEIAKIKSPEFFFEKDIKPFDIVKNEEKKVITSNLGKGASDIKEKIFSESNYMPCEEKQMSNEQNENEEELKPIKSHLKIPDDDNKHSVNVEKDKNEVYTRCVEFKNLITKENKVVSPNKEKSKLVDCNDTLKAGNLPFLDEDSESDQSVEPTTIDSIEVIENRTNAITPIKSPKVLSKISQKENSNSNFSSSKLVDPENGVCNIPKEKYSPYTAVNLCDQNNKNNENSKENNNLDSEIFRISSQSKKKKKNDGEIENKSSNSGLTNFVNSVENVVSNLRENSTQGQLNSLQSIFDIPENVKHTKTSSDVEVESEVKNEKSLSSCSELDKFFSSDDNEGEELTHSKVFKNCENLEKIQTDLSEDVSGKDEILEEKILTIFKEICHVRLLSPIREIPRNKDTTKSSPGSDFNSYETHQTCRPLNPIKTYANRTKDASKSRKRPGSITTCIPSKTDGRNKKIKLMESTLTKQETTKKGEFLDSLMLAMSVQNEEFTSKPVNNPTESPVKKDNVVHSTISLVQSEKTAVDDNEIDSKNSSETKEVLSEGTNICSPSKSNGKREADDVLQALKKFVSLPMTSKEESEKAFKECISVLSNKTQGTVARSIVTIIFENADENIETFERPAPPLTRTQHRFTALLSTLKVLGSNFERILSTIMEIIIEKIMPDNFFWPDNCVERAAMFYVALCRMLNDSKIFWKFCLRAMTEMKQRCCIVVFAALKTWPDVLHDASTLKNNILAVTVVNIFFHMSKSDGRKNQNQSKKLLALKHLLIKFYNFSVDNTIENITQKVFDSFLKEEKGSNKSLVLLAKCREWNWTSKNILNKLRVLLKEWSEHKVEFSLGNKILAVIKQIIIVSPMENEKTEADMKDLINCLSEILFSGKQSHTSEIILVEALLKLKHYPEARKSIREWTPREEISNTLRNEIIHASAENVLREVKLNPRKDFSERKHFRKFKNQSKKSKGQKKKGKKKHKAKKKTACTG